MRFTTLIFVFQAPKDHRQQVLARASESGSPPFFWSSYLLINISCIRDRLRDYVSTIDDL
jgi:hypothetical protein